MSNLSSSSISPPLLILVLLFSLFTYPSLSMRIIKDVKTETDIKRESSGGFADQRLMGEADHVLRVNLHEVHSGPNPISNSIPTQDIKNNLEGRP